MTSVIVASDVEEAADTGTRDLVDAARQNARGERRSLGSDFGVQERRVRG
jgi:hypothetical protein